MDEYDKVKGKLTPNTVIRDTKIRSSASHLMNAAHKIFSHQYTLPGGAQVMELTQFCTPGHTHI